MKLDDWLELSKVLVMLITCYQPYELDQVENDMGQQFRALQNVTNCVFERCIK